MTAIDTRSHGTKRARSSGKPANHAAAAGPTTRSAGSGRNEPDQHSSTFHMLNHLMQRDDGWLRMVPHPLDDVLYLKWKFNKGQHSGCYVMSRVASWQLDYGLDLLLDKLAAVDDGSKRPTRDTAYDG